MLFAPAKLALPVSRTLAKLGSILVFLLPGISDTGETWSHRCQRHWQYIHHRLDMNSQVSKTGNACITCIKNTGEVMRCQCCWHRWSPFRDQIYQTTSFSDTKLTDTEIIRYWAYQLPNLSDTELIRHPTYQITNLTNTKLIRYRTDLILNMSDIALTDAELGLAVILS